jgi:hypothetical protein
MKLLRVATSKLAVAVGSVKINARAVLSQGGVNPRAPFKFDQTLMVTRGRTVPLLSELLRYPDIPQCCLTRAFIGANMSVLQPR